MASRRRHKPRRSRTQSGSRVGCIRLSGPGPARQWRSLVRSVRGTSGGAANVWGGGAGWARLRNRKRCSSFRTKPAAPIAVTVSRPVRQPANSRGHTVPSAGRGTRRIAPSRSAATCSKKRSCPSPRYHARISSKTATRSTTEHSTSATTAASNSPSPPGSASPTPSTTRTAPARAGPRR